MSGYVGFRLGETIAEEQDGVAEWAWRVGPAAGLFLLGAALTPLVAKLAWRFLQQQVGATRPSTIVLGTVGLFAGLVVAALLSFPLGHLPSPFGDIMPFIATVAGAALGVAFFASREAELLEFAGRYAPILQPRVTPAPAPPLEYVLDTSAIVDGRIREIAETRFLNGTLVVPALVLDELRHLADSSDDARRTRGRRGLETLTEMQHGTVPLAVLPPAPPANGEDVDSRLVALALERSAALITCDYNLDRIAGLQGLWVLNVNRLAAAMRPVVAPGEELTIRVVQEGREANQGVGYLDDGTMVVVENGRRAINSDSAVVVTRILQTAAGRMVFAQLKG